MKLTVNVARAILADIAESQTNKAYAGNKGWTWWAYDAGDKAFAFGDGVVTVVQRPRNDEWGDKDEGDTEVVFEFQPDAAESPTYFRVLGEYTSYNGDTWNEGTFKEVRPTAIVKRVFEAVK